MMQVDVECMNIADRDASSSTFVVCAALEALHVYSSPALLELEV